MRSVKLASLARASSTAFSRASTTSSKAAARRELGVGPARLEAELRVAVGDAGCGLDHGEEGAQSGASALEDEQTGKQERDGRDEQLDEKQIGDGVVDACAAGGKGTAGGVKGHTGTWPRRVSISAQRFFALSGRGTQ
jgi:hypothetical protein